MFRDALECLESMDSEWRAMIEAAANGSDLEEFSIEYD